MDYKFNDEDEEKTLRNKHNDTLTGLRAHIKQEEKDEEQKLR